MTDRHPGLQPPNESFSGAEEHISFFEHALLSEKEESSYRTGSAESSLSGGHKKHTAGLNTALKFFIAAAVIVAAVLFIADIAFMADIARLPSEVSGSLSVSSVMMIVSYFIIAGISVSSALFFNFAIRRPLVHMLQFMDERLPVPLTGAAELRELSAIYNSMLADIRFTREKLGHAAAHDPLTGLYNRGAYEMFIANADLDHIGILMIDVDHFKAVNDNYGHDVGDLVLKSVANALRHSFRSSDAVCRIGGDEFIVILFRSDSGTKDFAVSRIRNANNVLSHPSDGLPPVTLSAGAAFSDRENPSGTIFQDADTALYRVKNAGRCGCCVY